MSKRVLVTGSLGFTGQYLTKALLDAGHEVLGMGTQKSDGRPDYVLCDLRDSASLRAILSDFRPNVIIHLAAVAFVAHGNVDEIYNVNILGTRSLFEALSQYSAELESVLVVSSANVYGNSAEGALSESTPCLPENDYGLTKLAVEHLSRIWQKNLPIFLLRPFNYTGVGQSERFLIPKIVKHFRKRADIIELGNVDVWRDFSDVRYVAAAYVRLIAANPVGMTLNICSCKAVSIREVISILEKISGHEIDIRVNPEFVRKDEIVTLTGNNSLLKQIVGDMPEIELYDTLEWMYRF